MTRWLIISAESGAQIGDPITSDEAPTPEASQCVERCPLEWPDSCEWDPVARGFRDKVDLLQALRLERNARLLATDWWMNADVVETTDPAVLLARKEYRQALRDMPATTTDLSNPDWPTRPA